MELICLLSVGNWKAFVLECLVSEKPQPYNPYLQIWSTWQLRKWTAMADAQRFCWVIAPTAKTTSRVRSQAWLISVLNLSYLPRVSNNRNLCSCGKPRNLDLVWLMPDVTSFEIPRESTTLNLEAIGSVRVLEALFAKTSRCLWSNLGTFVIDNVAAMFANGWACRDVIFVRSWPTCSDWRSSKDPFGFQCCRRLEFQFRNQKWT